MTTKTPTIKLMLVTKVGQLKKGDTISIIAKAEKDNYKAVTVKEVIKTGDSEEIIINKSNNCFYITKMMLNGESWVKAVFKYV